MHELRGVVRHYDWGDLHAIPGMLGVPADGRPWAELWFGGHPSAPCAVLPTGRSLADHVRDDPGGVIGDDAAREFPLLLKVLAAARPLSIQAHPDPRQAQEGFAREEAAGIPRDAPHRTYRDPHAKPELICALSPFEALCGLRAADATLDLLDHLGAPDPLVAPLQAAAGDTAGLGAVLDEVLALPADRVDQLVAAVVRATPEEGTWAAEGAVLRRLATLHPGDVGVLVAALLNLVVLQPGQALYLDAGVLHAYLSGMAVEVQAPSDNVVRGGLTAKHVDADELRRILDPRVVVPTPETPAGPRHRYDVPGGPFALTRLALPDAGGPLLGPGLLLVTEGEAELAGAAGHLRLGRGGTALIRADEGAVTVTGSGTAHWAHTPGEG